MPPIAVDPTHAAAFEQVEQAVSSALPPSDYRIPEPELSLLERLMFRRPERYVANMRKMLVLTAASMHRHPTQEEVDTLCEITYKESRMTAWATPLTFGLAGYLAWKGRGTFRFPLYQPKFVRFNPSAWPTTDFAILRNDRAQRFWHYARFVAYSTTSFFVVAPAISFYATSAAITASRTDNRLSDLRRDMKPGALLETTIDQMTPDQMLQMRRKTAASLEALERNRSRLPSEEALARGKSDEEATKRINQLRKILAEGDAQLTAMRQALALIDRKLAEQRVARGAAPDTNSQIRDYEALSSSGYPATPSLPAEPSRGARPGFAAPPETPAQESRPGWGEQDSPSQQGWGPAGSRGWDDDDASPVAPASRPAPQQSTGSSWDRLRQSSKNPPRAPGSGRQNAQGQQGQSENSGDGFSYDRAEEERQVAKDKAQREFDELLERERRGEGQSSGKNSGW